MGAISNLHSHFASYFRSIYKIGNTTKADAYKGQSQIAILIINLLNFLSSLFKTSKWYGCDQVEKCVNTFKKEDLNNKHPQAILLQILNAESLGSHVVPGICPIRSIAFANSLIEGKQYIPEGDRRLFVSNKHILEYYKDKNKNSKLIEVAQHQPELDAPGTVYIVSRKADLPLLPNKYKGQNRYQLSHFAVAIKIDDQIHVFEKVSNQANKSKPFVKSYTLDEMNQKCRDKKREEFNLIIPVSECHSDIKEILNRRGSSN